MADSGVFSSETWAGRANGSNPNNTDFEFGAGTWFNNFYTYVSSNFLGAPALIVPYNGDPNEVSELWYNLNQNKSEIWIQWEEYIPANYTIVDDDPTNSQALGGGSKEFVLCSDGYSTNYPTLILGRYFQRREYDGGPLIPTPTKVFQLGNMSATNIAGIRQYDTIPHTPGYEQECLFDITVDLGTWQTRTLHVKMPTSAISNNGIIELWNKKANGVTYKIVDVNDGFWYGSNLNSTGGNYMNMGYILGSLGPNGFAEPTNFAVRSIKFSDNNNFGPVGGNSAGRNPFSNFAVRL